MKEVFVETSWTTRQFVKRPFKAASVDCDGLRTSQLLIVLVQSILSQASLDLLKDGSLLERSTRGDVSGITFFHDPSLRIMETRGRR